MAVPGRCCSVINCFGFIVILLHPERERERSVKVYYCGREDCEKGHFFGPAVRSHQLIHFVLKGKGIYRTEYGEYEIKEGEAFLIRPGEVTYYRADRSHLGRPSGVIR